MAGKIDILVLGGDGIGPEITAGTLAVLRAADKKFALGLAFETAEIGWAAHKRVGTTFPDEVAEKAKATQGVLLVPSRTTNIRRSRKAGSIPPAKCASASISTPTSARRVRA